MSHIIVLGDAQRCAFINANKLSQVETRLHDGFWDSDPGEKSIVESAVSDAQAKASALAGACEDFDTACASLNSYLPEDE